MKKYKIRFLAQLGDFSGCNKNLIKISALNFAKIAFFTHVVIEGEIFSTVNSHCKFHRGQERGV